MKSQVNKKWYEKVSDWLIGIGFIIIIPILICNLTIIYKSVKYPDKIPDLFGYKYFIVLSGSMEGTLDKGDLAVVKIVDPNSLRKNDVISFRNDDIVVTHRIVKVNTDEKGRKTYTTKGDNTFTEDNELVKDYNVEGKLIKKYTGLGNILLFIASPTGMLINILIVLVVFFIGNYIYEISENKKNKEELAKYKK